MNWKSIRDWFVKPTPPNEIIPEWNPLSGKKLRYLIADENQMEGNENEIIEVGYNGPKPKKGLAIRYCNLYDQTGTNKYGPYKPNTSTSQQYGEKVVDPDGKGWNIFLEEQCNSAVSNGFNIVEWDNPDGYRALDVMNVLGVSAAKKLYVIAKNPLSCDWDPTGYIAHKGVVGIVVEKGAGHPSEMDVLRIKAGKPALPVWFVAFNDGKAWAEETYQRARGYKNFYVTYSPDGEYTSSVDIGDNEPPVITVTPEEDKQFDKCVQLVLVHEGGNDDDPRDPGGRTSRGIIQSEWDIWRKTHKSLPHDVWQAPQDQVIAIYDQNYWLAMSCNKLPFGVDYCVFDCGVLDGISASAKFLQKVLHVPMDGKVGTQTIQEANRADPAKLINAACDARLAHLQSLGTWDVYGRGWSRRVSDVRRDALAMVRPVVQTIPVPPLKRIPVGEQSLLATKMVAAMKKKGFEVFVGPSVLNIIYVKSIDPDGTPNKGLPNSFDDVRSLVRVSEDGSASIVGIWEATTHPGAFWTRNPMNPGGAARIIDGQQTAWSVGMYHDQEALREVRPIKFTRDPKKLYKAYGPVYDEDIAVHHHGGYNYPHDDLGRSSAGCQVGRLVSGHQEFMRLVKTDSRYKADHGFVFTSTVLEAEDLIA